MIIKADLKKISDNVWEIPKTFWSDMRAPARVFASEKLLEEIFRDRSLEQLVNVATLPGIQKYALVMPDAHEGYGFPIGGVAAMDAEEGVISPGGIGYDINCIHPDAKILSPFGINLKAKDFISSCRDKAVIFEKSKKAKRDIQVINWFSRKETNHLYLIKTKFGFSLKATADHPVYDGEKMIKAGDLKIGDKAIIYPFEGIEDEKPKNYKLINRRKILAVLSKLKFGNQGNRHDQILRWFEKNNFLNLNLNNFQTSYLIKIIGLMFGDGTMNFVGKNKKGRAAFYGKKDDLENLRNDLSATGIKSRIYRRKKENFIKNNYGREYRFSSVEYSLCVASSSFVILLHILGCPLGNKTKNKFSAPSWIIKEAPLWQKRLFLASFFGAEMSAPKTFNKYNFYSPTININKSIELKNNGKKFLEDLRNILRLFAVDSTPVKEINGGPFNRKTTTLRFQISGYPENLTRFFGKINFEYHREKQKLANIAIAYLKYKENVLALRKITREMARVFYQQGISVGNLVKNYARIYANRQFIEHSVWSEGRNEPRIAFNFPSFEEFIKKFSWGENGFIKDEIESIEKESYSGFVYDITVNHKGHNFIADNFVVSNCGVRLLRSPAKWTEIKPRLEELADELFKTVPSGLGEGGALKLSKADLDKVLKNGAKEILERGFGEQEDLEHLEAGGRLDQAAPDLVSDLAKKRGNDQVGTLGSGNHFLEVQRVDEIFDEQAAEAFGLFKDQLVVSIHTGSRGLGHQIATDYIRLMMKVMPRYGIVLPDRELACVPFKSKEGQDYFKAMCSGANFAFANRQMLAHLARLAFKNIFGNDFELKVVYDLAHN
ncbi:MAG: RtcB family protein, partial [Patescibacteria group bacterium]